MEISTEELERLAREHILVHSPTVTACEAFLQMSKGYTGNDVVGYAIQMAKIRLEGDMLSRKIRMEVLRSTDWWND